MARPVKYTREMLEEAVRNCVNFAEVMRYFGLEPNGGYHTHLSRRIRALGIDTSHFTGRPRITQRMPYIRHGWRDLLVRKPSGSRPENLRFLCPNCHSRTPTWAGRNVQHRIAPE